MNPRRRPPWPIVLVALAFGGIFLLAGLLKIQNPAAFLADVRSFHLLGDPWAALLALALPWLEIFCGLAVILRWNQLGGLILLNLSLIAFLIAICQAWVRGINISCGCFGKLDHGATHLELVVRDLLFLAAGIFLLLREWRTDAANS